MIEMHRLKNFVIFIKKVLSFVLSRKIINICNYIARKYGNFTVKDFRKHEKLEYKKKLTLEINFLNNCKQLGGYPKFLIFKLPNVSNKNTLSISKRLLSFVAPSTSVIKNYNIFQKNSAYSKTLYVHNFLLLTSTYLQNL